MKHSRSRHTGTLPYGIKFDKRGHALLYHHDKLIIVLNSRDTEALKAEIEHEDKEATQHILEQCVKNF